MPHSLSHISPSLFASLLFFVSANPESHSSEPAFPDGLSTAQIKHTVNRLRPLHQRLLDDPKPGEWLAEHKEAGQTFSQYLRSKPNGLTAKRKCLYVQPIGSFTDKQTVLVEKSAEFLSLYFQCEVKILPTMDEGKIPSKAKRKHPSWGDHQLLASHILSDILAPKLPSDAFATIAFTTSDLWPRDGWNFVFGLASLRDRVGVWSLYRLGDPEGGAEAFQQCLMRTIKVATHETGHMFSIKHCTRYRCNMQGSNSLLESDQQPLFLCPQCHAKMIRATGSDPTERFDQLLQFSLENKFKDPSEYFSKAKKAVSK